MSKPSTWIGLATNLPSQPPRFLALLVAAQAFLGARVLLRLLRGAGGQRIYPPDSGYAVDTCLSVVVPVLNERHRLAPCLDGLIAQGPEVGEILIVDGGSDDGTQDLVRSYRRRDRRVILVDASPVPAGWNGKAWGLQAGFERGDARLPWMLSIDADVRPQPLLARALLAHAGQTRMVAFSVATKQVIAGTGEGLIHPAMLATLVYRFGRPGRAFRYVREVQANGQCFLARRDILRRHGGFVVARASRCEDVTLARALVVAGHRVGFYEAGDLVSVEMYANWRDAWRNWPRSLPMRDQFFNLGGIAGLCEVTLVQALPLPLFALLCAGPRGWGPRWMLAVSGFLVATRLGVLAGTARAYCRVPWSYWLSPLCDMPVACRLWLSMVQRRHVWRGRVLAGEGTL